MRCKKCGKTCKSIKSSTWKDFQICPRCFDMRKIEDNIKYDEITFTKELPPIDLYLNYWTIKEMIRNER